MALSQQNRLTKRDFLEIKNKSGLWAKGAYLRVKSVKNSLPVSRFGFVVGIAISKKATERNKIKRVLKSLIQKDLQRIKKGFDIIVIASPQIAKKKNKEIGADLEKVLKSIKLLSE